MRTVDELVQSSVRRTPDSPALINPEDDHEVSYSALDEQISQITAGLRNYGVQPQDRVAICMQNTREHVITFLATQRLGAVAVPINFRASLDELHYFLRDAEPVLLICDRSVIDTIKHNPQSLKFSNVITTAQPTSSFIESFDSLRVQSPEPVNHQPAPEDLSVVQYSSGTTGRPKGIKITHEGSVNRVLLNTLGQRIYHKETMVGVMPLYHTVGLHGILLTMLTTSGTYIPLTELNPNQYLDIISTHEVSVMHEAPTVYQQLLETPHAIDTDFDSIEVIAYSGAPMTNSLFEKVKRTLDPSHLFNIYGMTEAYTPQTQINLRHREDPRIIGRNNLLHETRIVEIGEQDPTAHVGTGEEGELIVNTRSPCVFEGYLNRPEAEAEAIVDGWYFSGDTARKTENGEVIITGRANNLVISGGENIHPEEVEDVLEGHPCVQTVVVKGIPDEKWGEVLKALVVPDGDISSDELNNYILQSDALADYKRPREYEFLDEIPRNASGKKIRYELD